MKSSRIFLVQRTILFLRELNSLNAFPIHFLIIFLLLNSCGKVKPLIITKPAHEIVHLHKNNLLVGFGKAIITPAMPEKRFLKGERIPKKFKIALAGYRRKRYALGVHDDLLSSALVIKVANKSIGIVYLDLLGLHYPHIQAIREYSNKLGIDYLIIAATHNHQGPDTMGLWGTLLKSGINDEYIQFLKVKVHESLQNALNNLTPSKMYVHQSSVKHLKLTIDLRVPKFVPDILSTIQFRKKTDDSVVGTVVHWENHPEALHKYNRLITSDFPHYIRELVEQKTGKPCVYWSGALGGLLAPAPEINHKNKKTFLGSFEHAEVIGKLIGQQVLKMQKIAAEVRVDCFQVLAEKAWMPTTNLFYKIGSKLNILKRKMPKWGYFETEVATIKLGQLSLQTIPGEIYPELFYGPVISPKNADFPNATIEKPVIQKMLHGKYRLALGLALDEVGYIIPKNGWDNKKPYLNNSKKESYGEELSPGKEFSKNLHQIIEHLQNIVHNTETK